MQKSPFVPGKTEGKQSNTTGTFAARWSLSDARTWALLRTSHTPGLLEAVGGREKKLANEA